MSALAHWEAILSACDECVRVDVNACLATMEPDAMHKTIERFANISVPDAVKRFNRDWFYGVLPSVVAP